MKKYIIVDGNGSPVAEPFDSRQEALRALAHGYQTCYIKEAPDSPAPGPLSPAEWLARKYGQHLPDLPIGMVLQEMEAYAAHVASLENQDVRHRAAEIVVGYHDDGLTFLVEAIHRDIMNIPFPARPDGEKHEPPC